MCMNRSVIKGVNLSQVRDIDITSTFKSVGNLFWFFKQL